MRSIDVFNGDADGICSLIQLRLAEPEDTVLVTGTKRDIELLRRVEADPGDRVTVFDIALDRNREALERLLARGVSVRYFDHHYPGRVPSHPGLEEFIDPAAGVCTAMLVDRYLKGHYRAWTVVAAFGDNLIETGLHLGGLLGIGAVDLAALRELGEGLNYNAYGEREADLLMPPADLYRLLCRFEDPLSFIHAEREFFHRLGAARKADMDAALEIEPHWTQDGAGIYVLPNASWSRRVSGTFANFLASIHPQRPQAVLVPCANGTYSVSVRAPGDGIGADEFCRQFSSGGGRRQAAGLQGLEVERLDEFVSRFSKAFRTGPPRLI